MLLLLLWWYSQMEGGRAVYGRGSALTSQSLLLSILLTWCVLYGRGIIALTSALPWVHWPRFHHAIDIKGSSYESRVTTNTFTLW